MPKLSYLLFVYFILSIPNNTFSTKLFAQEQNNSEQNVLVLHSYHQGLAWTDSITNGIRAVFKDRPDINLIFEYLDTKRNYNEEYFTALQNIYKVKAKQIPFQAIITSDNAAFTFMKDHGSKFYPDIPVIYCGVNDLDRNILKDYPNFFGYGEKADHHGTLSSIKKIFPERKNIFIINDNTLTGKAIQRELDGIIEEFEDVNFESISEFTMESLQQTIRNLDDSYVIYLLVVNRDKNGNFISYQKGITQIKEVAHVPIFGSWDFYLNKGLFGGKITRGYEQGSRAATLALKLMQESFTNDIPQFNYLPSTYVFDHNELIKFDISINQLPENSIILNEPKDLSLLIKISLISIIILILVVLSLIIWLKIKQKRAIVLQNLVLEKTSKLNETNQELEKVIQNKDKFFSILAHDLRGSIGVILNLSSFINNEEIEISEEEKNEFNRDIFHVVTRTSTLLEDLFYWGTNQIKGGPELDYSQFDINEVLQEISKTFKINLSDVSFEIDDSSELKINSDLNICKFIFRNIIQNAIKYSNKGGCVWIRSYTKENKFYIEVKDQGIGMSKEIIESIYQKNPIRIEGLSGQKTTGLGLPTVLDYLDILEGELLIKSEPDKGSTFTIVLKNKN
ncbi:MAG: sensor histidine kinase [Labilibaculum sp.]|nr:sensor histidine kinase [Labilibaculum sp.]MBI9058857.1 sensor histidine kinase [Labilibaculum sp.]